MAHIHVITDSEYIDHCVCYICKKEHPQLRTDYVIEISHSVGVGRYSFSICKECLKNRSSDVLDCLTLKTDFWIETVNVLKQEAETDRAILPQILQAIADNAVVVEMNFSTGMQLPKEKPYPYLEDIFD